MSRFGPIDAIIRQQEEDRYTTQVLDLREVEEHPRNDFPITKADIEKLADSILKSGGILQFPLVRRLDDGTYQMLAGHRRRRASILLGESGHEEYFKTMCHIVEGISDEKAELYLIDTNIQARELSPRLRAKKIADARDLIETLKKRKEIQVSSIRRAVAEFTGVSESTVILQTRIAEKLIGELMELYDEGKFTMREAYDYSGLSEIAQGEIMEAYESNMEKDQINQLVARLALQEKVGAGQLTAKEKEAKKKLKQAFNRISDVVELKKDGVPVDYKTLRQMKRLIDSLMQKG